MEIDSPDTAVAADEAPFAPTADDLVAANASFSESFGDGDLQAPPTRRMAIVTCMDARLDVFALFGLANGEAHVIRNGGGVVTDDVIRSLCLSQRYLGTREVVLVHHTSCGLQTVTEDGVKADLQADLGVKPPWSIESFDDPDVDVAQSMKRVENSPFLPHKDHIRGFVYDVSTGRLNEVGADGTAS